MSYRPQITAVPNVAALAALTLESFDGASIFVLTLKAFWEYVASGADFVVDHITVEETTHGGDTRWVRTVGTSQAWSAQPTWYINAITGEDENVGLTTDTPLKTWSELSRRCAQATMNITVDIYVETDLLADDLMLLYGTWGPNGACNIHGVSSILHSGVLTGVIAYDQATGQWDELQETGVDFSPYVGKLAIIQTGDVNGPSYAWILKAMGSGRARVSFLSQHIPNVEYGAVVGPAAVGDSYEIVSLPTVPIFDQKNNTTFNINKSLGPVFIEQLSFSYPVVRQEFVAFSDCYFDGFICYGTNGYFVNCCFATTAIVNGLFSNTLGAALNCTLIVGQGMWISFGIIWQSSQLDTRDTQGNGNASNFEAHHASTGLGIFDSTNPIILAEGATLLLEGALWGSQNVGTTITMLTGGRTYVDVPASARLYAITPVGGNDFTIDGAVALPAVDPTTYAFSAARDLTFANYLADYDSGGFQKSVFNPRWPSTGMTGG